MSDREDRLNVLRKAKGLKTITIKNPIIVVEKEMSPFEESLAIKEKKPIKKKRTTKKKEIVVETNEEINNDSLFETETEPVNKIEEKTTEQLNEE